MHCFEGNSSLYSHFTPVHTDVLFQEPHPERHVAFCHICLTSPAPSLLSFLAFHELEFWGDLAKYFVEYLSIQVWCFYLWLYWGFGFGSRKLQKRMQCPPHYIILGGAWYPYDITQEINLHLLILVVKEESDRFLHCKVIISSSVFFGSESLKAVYAQGLEN